MPKPSGIRTRLGIGHARVPAKRIGHPGCRSAMCAGQITGFPPKARGNTCTHRRCGVTGPICSLNAIDLKPAVRGVQRTHSTGLPYKPTATLGQQTAIVRKSRIAGRASKTKATREIASVSVLFCRGEQIRTSDPYEGELNPCCIQFGLVRGYICIHIIIVK